MPTQCINQTTVITFESNEGASDNSVRTKGVTRNCLRQTGVMFTQIQWPTLIELLLFVSHYPACCHLFDLHSDSRGSNCYYLHFTEKDTVADTDGQELMQGSLIRAWVGVLGLNSGPLNLQLLYWTIVSCYLLVGDLRPWSRTG